MPEPELIHCATPEILARKAANRWLDELASILPSLSERPCTVALSGGRIATQFFRELAAQANARKCDLGKLEYFWADERCVPPTDQESNFRLAQENLLAPLQIPLEKVHRIRGELGKDAAAREAEAEICRIAPLNDDGQPILDFVFLGMGEDGHVASLFPGGNCPDEDGKAVYRGVLGTKPPPERVTLNYPALARAGQVWVLASGAGKEQALRDSLKEGAITPLGRTLGLRQGRALILTDINLNGAQGR